MFLSIEDIERLTGYKHKSKQCAQLDAMHIPYRLNAMGEPIVCASYIDGVKAVKQTPTWQPNLSKAA